MKQLLAIIELVILALGMPATGYGQDTKAKAESKSEAKAKSDDKGKGAAKSESKGKSDDKGKAAGKAATEIIDINTATAAQLMTLDGIGDARAEAIIKGRPYRAKNQLVDKKILPETTYEKIKDRMIARQPTTKK